MSQLKQISLQIKPLCDEIIKNPSIEIIDSLNEELKSVENQYLQQFRDFILLPIISQIDEIYIVNKNEIKTHLIYCIITLLEKIQLDKVVPLKTVLIVLLKQIYDVNTGLVIGSLSEELKLSIVECIDLSTRRLMSSVLDEFYVDENSKLIAQICHVCVQLIQNETYKKLKMSAMKCILSVFQLHDEADLSDVVLREQISNLVFIILPKIFTTLYHVTQEDDSKGMPVKVLALKSIRLVLTLIFEEYGKPEEASREYSVSDIKQLIKSGLSKQSGRTDEEILGMNLKATKDPLKKLHALESIKKTGEWFTAASKKLKLSLTQFVKLRSNPNREIRYELALMNCDLITKCSKTMKPCVQHYLETIITLTEDSDPEIVALCTRTLKNLMDNHRDFNVWFEVQTLFKSHLISLPRIVCREDIYELNAALMLLRAFIKFLSEKRLKLILADDDVLEKLLLILITTVQLDVSNDLLLEEHSLRDSEDVIQFDDNNLPWKKFKYLTTAESQEHMRKICQLLGASMASQIIFAELLNSIYRNPESSNEILILLNYCILDSDNKSIIHNILDEYLTEYHWNLSIHANTNMNVKATDNGETSMWYEIKTAGLYEGHIEMRYTDMKYRDNVLSCDQQITVSDSKLHVLHTCLIIEGTGNLSMRLKEDFHNFLFKTFHRFLEKAGSSNYMIHMSGMYALNKLRHAFGVPRISDMLHDTSDYLIYHLKILFRKNEYNHVGLDILCVVLKYSSILLLPYLQTIVNDVLAQDLYQRNDKTSFLKLFEMCVYAINKWSRKNRHEEPQIEQLTDNNSRDKSYDNVIGDFIEYMNQEIEDSVMEEIENVESEMENEDIDDPDNDPTAIQIKPELPQPIALTLTILNTCIKHISSKNQTEQLIVLRTINEGVQILSEHENEYLPFIHMLWNPLAERFQEKNLVVISSSLVLVVTLARLSKDFIRQRATKTLIPALNSFLQESAKENLTNARENYNITLSQNVKLQNDIIKNYATLVTHLELEDRTLNLILDTMKVYGRTQQPRLLQESWNEFVTSLLAYDPSSVVVKLMHTDGECKVVDDILESIRRYNGDVVIGPEIHGTMYF